LVSSLVSRAFSGFIGFAVTLEFLFICGSSLKKVCVLVGFGVTWRILKPWNVRESQTSTSGKRE